MLKRPELFLNAYTKIAGNRGSLTPGVDGETVDDMSLPKLDDLRLSIRNGTFKWTPVRRVYIPKKNGDKRPLGIPGWKDRIVQEVIRVILEAYYEPKFSNLSHGFRPERSCHTALQEVGKWKGTVWFIEGDIKGCFDNISHSILLEILERDIHDNRFIKLIRQMLEAGYLEDWKYYGTFSGTPQGGIVSPLLSNIFLTELDKQVESLLGYFNSGKKRKHNNEYNRVSKRMRKLYKEGRVAAARELEKQRRGLRYGTDSDDYRRLRYVRYADDFLLGFIGPRKEAEEIKGMLKEFLGSIELQLSEEKTLITHAKSQPARFLGYEVTFPINVERPVMNGKPMFKIPKDVQKGWTDRYRESGKPERIAKRLHNSEYEIITSYGAELRGFYNYYRFAHNVGNVVARIKWIMTQSLAKTLANKLRISQRQVYRKFKKKNRDTYSMETIANGSTAVFGGFSIQRKKDWTAKMEDRIEVPWAYYGRNELSQRHADGKCEIPGCERTDVEGHHIRAMKDLTGKTWWEEEMIARQRKTLVVCRMHHQMIESGKYDGVRLKDLATDRRA
jgi:group II intron reverse transcriptase/maturase